MTSLLTSIKGTRALGYISEQRGRFAFLVALSVASTALDLLIVEAQKSYMNALQSKDTTRFYWALAFRLLVLLAAWSPFLSYKTLYLNTLGFRWRLWMSDRYYDRYLRVHYEFNAGKPPGNVDERLTETMATVTQWMVNSIDLVVGKSFAVVAYGRLLYQLNPLLTLVALVYAALGNLLLVGLLKKRLREQHKELKDAEGNLRYSVGSIRECSEAIAFYQSEKTEKQNIILKTRALESAVQRLYHSTLLHGITLRVYDVLMMFIPVVFIAPSFYRDEITFGDIIAASFAFRQLLLCLGAFVSNIGGMSAFQGAADRLLELNRHLKSATFSRKASKLVISNDLAESISFDSLVLTTPDGTQISCIIGQFEMSPQSRGLLIQGPSGVGKTTLLRALAGIWSHGSGTISMPERRKCFFLSQQPYMPRSCKTLRQSLCYPGLPEHAVSDGELVELMAHVGLEGKSLDLVADAWERVLSVGERQRVTFIRGILHVRHGGVLWLFLDESTSSLDVEAEKRCYELLLDSSARFVSVGHRETINKYHDQTLTLST